jgi:hypothetical protein
MNTGRSRKPFLHKKDMVRYIALYLIYRYIIDMINLIALGLSSCFILLSTSLLYANSGTTNLDSLYIITSISNVSGDNLSGLLY